MVEIRYLVTQDEILRVLNTAPPSPAVYARFLEDYCRDVHPEKLDVARSEIREWAETETTAGQAGFVSNYLARALTIVPPTVGVRLSISQRFRDQINAALLSAYLRTLVDEWLETGRSPNGSESPANRHIGKTSQAWLAVSEYLGESSPFMSLDPKSGNLRVELAGPGTKSPLAKDFFTGQNLAARILFVKVLLSDWRPCLSKCRYASCGKYFNIGKVRRSYLRGTFCSPEHRAHERAQALTKARRHNVTVQLIEIAASYAQRLHPAWQDDPKLKIRVAAHVAKELNKKGDRRTRSGSVGVKWVTRYRAAIERRRLELAS